MQTRRVPWRRAVPGCFPPHHFEAACHSPGGRALLASATDAFVKGALCYSLPMQTVYLPAAPEGRPLHFAYTAV